MNDTINNELNDDNVNHNHPRIVLESGIPVEQGPLKSYTKKNFMRDTLTSMRVGQSFKIPDGYLHTIRGLISTEWNSTFRSMGFDISEVRKRIWRTS